MHAINSRQIEQWADDLALYLWPLWQGQPTLRRFNLRDEAPLADMLVPAIAAFAGRLMTLTPTAGQLAQLPAALGVFFGNPDTAAALDRYTDGETGAADELLQLLLAAGLDAGLPLRIYFNVALDTLLAAAEASLWHKPPSPPLEQEEGMPPPPALFGDVSPYLYADAKRFVAAYYGDGLSRIELGQAVAADGATVIYEWDPAPMAGGPPEELAESAGPDGGGTSQETGGHLGSVGELAAGNLAGEHQEPTPTTPRPRPLPA